MQRGWRYRASRRGRLCNWRCPRVRSTRIPCPSAASPTELGARLPLRICIRSQDRAPPENAMGSQEPKASAPRPDWGRAAVSCLPILLAAHAKPFVSIMAWFARRRGTTIMTCALSAQVTSSVALSPRSRYASVLRTKVLHLSPLLRWLRLSCRAHSSWRFWQCGTTATARYPNASYGSPNAND